MGEICADFSLTMEILTPLNPTASTPSPLCLQLTCVVRTPSLVNWKPRYSTSFVFVPSPLE